MPTSLEVVASILKTAPFFMALDVETTGLTRNAEIVSAAVTWRDANSVIQSHVFFLSRYRKGCEIDDLAFSRLLYGTLYNRDYSGSVVFHNVLFDMKLLLLRYPPTSAKTIYRFSSKDFCKIYDTQATSRIHRNNKFVNHIDPKQRSCHSLKYLAEEFKLLPPDQLKKYDFEKATANMDIRYAADADLGAYNSLDTVVTLGAFEMFRKNLIKTGEWGYVEDFEMPHLMNLLHLTWHGVPFDRERAVVLYDKLLTEMEGLERDIFNGVGKSFNLSSNQALGQALFYNPKLVYKSNSARPPDVLKPPYVTDGGQAAVDSHAIKRIIRRIRARDPSSTTILLLQKVLRYLELSKSAENIDRLFRYAALENDGYRLFPNISASALSGRVVCSKPNLLGLPKKLFKHSKLPSDDDAEGEVKFQALFGCLKDSSVRKLIRPGGNRKIHSIDINGLDLLVLAHGSQQFCPDGKENFYLRNILTPMPVYSLDDAGKIISKVPDSHFSFLQRLNPARYSAAFSRLMDEHLLFNFWAMKPSKRAGKSGVEFIERTPDVNGVHKSIFKEFPADGDATKDGLESLRELSKKINLATSYLMGAPSFAAKLTELEEGDTVRTVDEAQQLLDDFYKSPSKGFPEIRRFQDRIGNEIYSRSYSISPFGRRFYAATWDDLNDKHSTEGESAVYHFILQVGNCYWYLEALCWLKQSEELRRWKIAQWLQTRARKNPYRHFSKSSSRTTQHLACHLPTSPTRK